MNNLYKINNDYQQYKQSGPQKARELSRRGITRELKQFRTNYKSDPSRGGSTGYETWLRVIVMDHVYRFGAEDAEKHFGISRATLYRWNERLFSYQQTGNTRKNLVGRDQLLLSIAVFQSPISTADDIAYFIEVNGGASYSRQDIYARLHELGVSRKKGSVEAYEAWTPLNRAKAEMYWSQPPRYGIRGLDRFRMLDIDECHFTLKNIQSKYGYAPTPCRVRDIGHYKKGEGSVNLIMAIEPGNPAIPSHQLGSTEYPRRWFLIERNRNVNQYIFAQFIDMICIDIENNPKPGDDFRVFLWDNLSAHRTDLVFNTLEMRDSRDEFRFMCIPRPPYQPKFAPIEYIICQIATELSRRRRRGWNLDILEQELHNICATVGNHNVANKTWRHIGYN